MSIHLLTLVQQGHDADVVCCGVFAGVTAYTWHNVNFTVVGYVWIIIWYTFAVFEMVYVKKVVDTVKMTTWSRTYYQVIHKALTAVSISPAPLTP